MKRTFFPAALCVLIGLFVIPGTAAEDEGMLSPAADSEFADDLHFAMIENHLRTIEMCMDKIIVLSNRPFGAQKTIRNQEDHASNKLGRFIALKEEAADEIHNIISHYFLTIRVRNWPNVKKNPEGYGSQEYKNFTKMLEYLQSALTYNFWCKQLTMREKPRAVRNYMARFRTLWEDPANKSLRRGNYRNYVMDSEH